MTRRVSSPDLVGRGEQLAVLERALSDAASGTPRLVLVEGEAGIGKTRLVSEFTAEAAGRGVTVLRGGCVDLGDSAVPHLPLRAALAELIDAAGADTVLSLAGPGILALAPLLPDLAGRAPPDALLGRADASQLFDVVARLLDRLSHKRAVLLVVEDLHWADGSTRGLLGYLARALRTSRVAVVVTARTEPPPSESTTTLLDELNRLPQVDRIRLARLDRSDVARQLRGILGRSATAATLSRVTRLSQGVPFLVEELASAALHDPAAVPDTVHDLVLVRVRSLGTRARRVLAAAAVAATALDEPALSEVSDLPAAELETALRELVDAHLLVVDQPSGRYEFRHALVREAVTTDLLAAEIRRLHRRCAEIFQIRPDLALPSGRADALIAHHWWGAGDDARAYTSALTAADGAREVHAYEEEYTLRRRALELWPSAQRRATPHAPDRADLLWRAAKAADRLGELDAARELYEAARQALNVEEEPGRVAEVLFDEVGLLRHVGDLPDCEAATRQVLAALPAAPSLARARALIALQAFHYQRREIDELRAVTRDAIAVANRVGSGVLSGRARLTLIAARAADENSFLAQRAVRALATEAGDTDLLLTTYINESDGFLVEGCFAEAAQLARAGQQMAEQRGGKLDHHDLLLINLVSALIASGDWAEAETLLDDALLVDRPGALRANVHGFLSEVRLARGDLDGAEQAADEAHERLQDLRADPLSYPPIAAVRGDIALARGRPEEALEIVRRMYDEVGRSVAYPSVVWPALHTAARAIRAAGRRDRSRMSEAADWLARAAARQNEAQEQPWWEAASEAELSGNDDQRWRIALSAVETEQAPVLLRLRVLLSAARAELSAGRRGSARDLLDRVLRDAERLGAGLVLAEARDFAQRSRLILPDAERQPAMFELTSRELEVLRLLAAGRSNRQIGSDLFLSPKTVSVHVSHILTKMGVAGRGEAAALAFSHGLAAPESPATMAAGAVNTASPPSG